MLGPLEPEDCLLRVIVPTLRDIIHLISDVRTRVDIVK